MASSSKICENGGELQRVLANSASVCTSVNCMIWLQCNLSQLSLAIFSYLQVYWFCLYLGDYFVEVFGGSVSSVIPNMLSIYAWGAFTSQSLALGCQSVLQLSFAFGMQDVLLWPFV